MQLFEQAAFTVKAYCNSAVLHNTPAFSKGLKNPSTQISEDHAFLVFPVIAVNSRRYKCGSEALPARDHSLFNTTASNHL